MEYFFLWGTPSRTSVNSQWLRTMEGFNHRIQTNRVSVNGPLNEGEFDAFLTMGFQYGNSKKMLICSSTVANAINNFAKARLVVNDKADRYGVALRRYEHTEGDVEIVKHRELKGSVYGGYGYLIDWDYAVVRYLRAGAGSTEKYMGDRYVKRIRNIQANDADTRKDEFFSELCIQIMQEPTMAVVMGVTG